MIQYFQERDGQGRGRLLRNAAYRLVRATLARQDFGGFDRLMSFCEDSENLRPWLPSAADRIRFAEGLRRGLHEADVADVEPADGATAFPDAGGWSGLSGMLEVSASGGYVAPNRSRAGKPLFNE